MAKKSINNKFVIAVKDTNGFLGDLESGNIRMPGVINVYKELLASPLMKINSTKGLNKFIRKMGLSKKDCFLYWEVLVSDGYTIMEVEYNKGDLSMLCDGKNIKFLNEAKK